MSMVRLLVEFCSVLEDDVESWLLRLDFSWAKNTRLVRIVGFHPLSGRASDFSIYPIIVTFFVPETDIDGFFKQMRYLLKADILNLMAEDSKKHGYNLN